VKSRIGRKKYLPPSYFVRKFTPISSRVLAVLLHTLTQGGGQLARGQISYHVGKQYMQLFVSVSLSLQSPPVGVSTLSFLSDVKTTCESNGGRRAKISCRYLDNAHVWVL
jgi:hypothetical protein